MANQKSDPSQRQQGENRDERKSDHQQQQDRSDTKSQKPGKQKNQMG